jgi:adenylosuccinate synthase
VNSIITVGLGFGDEGKGTVVDALVRRYNAKLVIRYNGGAQCAHNVVTDDGRHHEFHQFGSGTLVPGCRTLLTKDVLVNPLVMFTEALQLEKLGVPNALKQMFIDERALVTTPFHRALNRLREYSRKEMCHGSCGMGIGETMADSIRRPHGALRIGDLLDQKVLREKLNKTRNEMVAQVKQLPLDGCYEEEQVVKELSTFDVPLEEIVNKYNRFAANVYILDQDQIVDLLNENTVAIFEGAQGVLLDENHGFHPYTTWSTTTSTNAHLFLNEFGFGQLSKLEIGVIRTYATRHGAGPFPTYNRDLTQKVLSTGEHNETGPWQKDFRCGWLDLALLNYALQLNGTVDGLAVTHVDRLKLYPQWQVTVDYPEVALEPQKDLMDQERHLTVPLTGDVKQGRTAVNAGEILELITSKMHTKILMTSSGATASHKKFNEKLLVHHLPHDHAARAVRAGTRTK